MRMDIVQIHNVCVVKIHFCCRIMCCICICTCVCVWEKVLRNVLRVFSMDVVWVFVGKWNEIRCVKSESQLKTKFS